MSVKRRRSSIEPDRCCLCGNMTNGYRIRDLIFCASCNNKFKDIPAHIPVDQFVRYYKAVQKKRRKVKSEC